MEQLARAYQLVEQQLRADGWLRATNTCSPTAVRAAEEVAVGNLFVWARGDMLMLLRDKRMDDEKPGEDERAGEYILYIELYPRGDELYREWEFPAVAPN